MPSVTLRPSTRSGRPEPVEGRRPSGGARLVVTVTAPDGAIASRRGLAAWLTKAAPVTARGEVTVALVSDGRMRTLNRSFRNKDYATDVLSFPSMRRERKVAGRPSKISKAGGLGPDPWGLGPFLGDIVIATGVANRQADDAGHSVATELKVLALHGLLHLLGFDHESDDGEMARAEARLRARAGLKERLIQRGRARALSSQRAGR